MIQVLTVKFHFRQWFGVALIAQAFITLTGALQAQSSSSQLAQAEVSRRIAQAQEAEVLIEKGDEAYQSGNYEKAVKAFQGALTLLPEHAPTLADRRSIALERFAQASVERAKELRRHGDLDQAKNVLKHSALQGTDQASLLAKIEREQLEDPIRTNPALTKEHAQNVEELRKLLYKAQGAYDLGNFDQSLEYYNSAMRIDRYNSAARRGMERSAHARSSYYKAAYDHTRSELLAEVDRNWELNTLPFRVPDAGIGTESGSGFLYDHSNSINDKAATLIIPNISLEEVTLPEAIDYLRARAMELDTSTNDPLQKGINIVLELGDEQLAKQIQNRQFSVNLSNVPIGQVFDYLAEASGTAVKYQSHAVLFRSLGAASDDMVIRTYTVPPDFLTRSNTDDSAASSGVNDPFAPQQSNEGGLLSKRLSAQEVLERYGVRFSEGASANFNPADSTMRMRNTQENHMLAEQVVELMANEEPTSVVIDVKIIKTTQTNLEELGFDWLLGNFGLLRNNKLGMAGGTQGNGGDLSDIAQLDSLNPGYPMTSGNRSGLGAVFGDTIDQLIADPDRNAGIGLPPRAPGALWVNGALNNTNVTMLMRALDQKKGIDMVAVPSVTTRSGQAASIRMIREFIYPTEYEPPEIPTSIGGSSAVQITIDIDTGEIIEIEDLSTPSNAFPVTPATPTTFEMRETGIILEALPTVSADKRMVDISLRPDVTEFDGFINYGSPIYAMNDPSPVDGIFVGGSSGRQMLTRNEIVMPVFSRLSTETALTIADNATIVIAGLLNDHRQTVEDKIPILGDIPVVGRMFQSKTKLTRKSAIVILLHVRTVDAGGRPFHP